MSIAGKWFPRSVRLLAQHGVAALQPQIDKGRYIAPMISKRLAANLRKRAIIEGSFGSFTATEGGWDPLWDETRKMFAMRAHKGHVRDRNRPERADKVTKAMEGMEDRFEKHQKEVIERRPKKDIVSIFKRIANITAKKSGGGKPASAPSSPQKKKK